MLDIELVASFPLYGDSIGRKSMVGLLFAALIAAVQHSLVVESS
jgi:hypothetical protein